MKLCRIVARAFLPANHARVEQAQPGVISITIAVDARTHAVLPGSMRVGESANAALEISPRPSRTAAAQSNGPQFANNFFKSCPSP